METVFAKDSPLISVEKASETDIPCTAGLYCILAGSGSEDFLSPFADLLKQRSNPLLYIGKAGDRGLRKRLLNEELRGIGAGTFFRSLGVVLGHAQHVKPLSPASRNFRFDNAPEIVKWCRRNLWVAWKPTPVESVEEEEKALIGEHRPLFNLRDNPKRSAELSRLRAACLRLAHGRYRNGGVSG